MHREIIRLNPGDAERYTRLRMRMLTEAPWAFAASAADDVALDIAHVRTMLAEKENAIVAIEAVHATDGNPDYNEGHTPELIAAAGVVRVNRSKFAHRARIWGLFVDTTHRGKGLGRALMTAAMELAETWRGVEFIDLGVSANSPEAQRLYETLGFKEWGREPETTQCDGRRYDEIYMTFRTKHYASA